MVEDSAADYVARVKRDLGLEHMEAGMQDNPYAPPDPTCVGNVATAFCTVSGCFGACPCWNLEATSSDVVSPRPFQAQAGAPSLVPTYWRPGRGVQIRGRSA